MLITAFVPDLAGTIVTQEELWEEPLFVALPACHRLARQRPLSWPDLATLRLHVRAREGEVRHFGSLLGLCAHLRDYEEHDVSRDRKRVVEGKSVSVRVEIGGRRIITEKTKINKM